MNNKKRGKSKYLIHKLGQFWRSVILCFLAFYPTLILAQGKTIHFDQIKQANDLLLNNIMSIAQDNKGFMWFGTSNGLYRYDGYEFKNYQHDPRNPNSLSNNEITALITDKSGNLWVGTRLGGLNLLDHTYDNFKQYKHNPSDYQSLSHNKVNTIYEDQMGVLWVGTQNGLNRFNKQNKTFTHFLNNPVDSENVKHNDIRSIKEDQSGQLWIGTFGGGLSLFNITTTEFTNYIHDPNDSNSISSNNITVLFVDPINQLWIGTLGGGLNRFDSSSNHFIKYAKIPNDYTSLSGNEITSMQQDQAGNFWVGTKGGGLNNFDPENGTFIQNKHQISDPKYSISYDYINDIYEDSNGVVWISTGRGLNTYHPMHQQFEHFRHHPDDPNSINDNMVWSIFEESNGNLWICTQNGLNHFDQKTKKMAFYLYDESDPYSLSDDSCSNILKDSNNNLWIGTRNGLNLYDPANNRFIRFQHDPSNPDSLSNSRIGSVFEDNKGVLWIGTGFGLNRFDPIKQSFSHYLHDESNPNSISNNNIDHIYQDQQGQMWFGTRGGLNLLDQESQQFIRYVHNETDEFSLGHNSIRTIYQDKNQSLWVTTYGGGLNLFDPENQLFYRYGEHNGLPHNVTYGILEDGDGHLWISTDNGLSKFDPITSTFKNYTTIDGLQNQEFSGNSSYVSEDGKMFFGGMNGYNAFYPHKIMDDLTPPKLVFIDFLLFNKVVPIHHGTNVQHSTHADLDFHLSKSIDEIEIITLNHNEDIFSFTFAGIQYNEPAKNKYAYMLEGFDQDWILTEAKNRRATYTNIPAGRYTFKFKASNKDGVWTEQSKNIGLVILPAPWKTWWAYLLYTIMLSTVMFNFYWQRNRKIKAIKERNKQLTLTSKLFENTSEGVWLLDSNYCYIAVNQGFIDTTGKREVDVLGQPFSIPTTKTQKADDAISILASVRSGNKWKGELWDTRETGEIYPVDMVIDKIESDGPDEKSSYQFVGVFTDITERKKNELKLKRLAFHDDLTQLPNRTSFQNSVDREIQTTTNHEHSPFFIMFIDLDDFKMINDSLGHKKGDSLLKVLANKFKLLLSKHITVARLGGDEFLVLVSNAYIQKNIGTESLPKFAKDTAKYLLNLISETAITGGYHLRVTASAGVVIYPENGNSYEVLLRNADTAMYCAKKEGRNLVQLYTNDMNVKAKLRFEVAEKMKKDLNQRRFIPYFQPKISMINGEPNNVEVLARWHTEAGEIISPIEFIPIAEETGLISQLGEQVFEQACEVILNLIQQNQFHGRMAINLSPLQFRQDDLIQRIDAILTRTQFPAEHLELEITESAVMADVDQAVITMDQIRQRNIHISIDDFGTGYSSLSYLAQYPISSLKIDSSFIAQLSHSKKDEIIIDAIIKLAHSLGLKVVAEGVENKADLDYLIKLNCDEIQGFYYNPPMKAADYIKVVQS